MDIEINDGFNITFAKRCGRPQYIFFKDRKEVVNWFMNNLNNVDFVAINDKQIDTNRIINENILLKNYLEENGI